uniref:Uncharacterized protein n=1 Tax=Romanomermis culicivorax TaxID=13658 RepID=A0A915JLI5_ROMCU
MDFQFFHVNPNWNNIYFILISYLILDTVGAQLSALSCRGSIVGAQLSGTQLSGHGLLGMPKFVNAVMSDPDFSLLSGMKIMRLLNDRNALVVN